MKKLMILGASILQLPAIVRAREMGLRVIAVDMDPEAVGFREEGVIREIISTNDVEGVLGAARKHRIDGIMTLASDMPMRTVARVGRELCLPVISEEAAFRATDKNAMRQALREHGVPIPAFFGVSSQEAFLEAVRRLPGDAVIVKPADSSGSRGVHLLRRGGDPLPAYRDSARFSRSGTVMVEEFMTGPEVSVEAITFNGSTEIFAITDKQVVGGGNFTEIGHTQPSALSPDVQNEIARVTRQTVAAIGIDHTPSHTELKVTPAGVKVVEIGARLGGDCITTHLVPLSTGVDMVGICVGIAVGEPVKEYPRSPNTAAIRYFQPPVGVITGISGVEEAKRLPGVREVRLLRGIGEEVPPITSSTERVGFVIAQGCGRKRAEDICARAMSLVRIDVAGRAT